MSCRLRQTVLISLGLCTLTAMMSLDPLPQDPAYHRFADNREIWSVPNFFNVTTNIPFAAIGLMGLWFTYRHQIEDSAPSWRVLFLGVSLVAFGSAYYHWIPSNQTLLWDRFPMAIGFMGLFVALLSEYVNPRLQRYLLIPAVLVGIWSVVHWHLADDLRIYIWVQCFPLLCILMLPWLFPAKYSHQNLLLVALASYGLAKATEVYDAEIFSLTHRQLSGHSLKHLIAASAVWVIYFMLRCRHTRPGTSSDENSLTAPSAR